MRGVALPESLRIGAFDVKVERWHPHAAGAQSRYGEWSSLELTVRLDVSVHPLKVLDTLLHEINHAVYWAYGLVDEDNEERTVFTLSKAWTQIYRDNPDLLPWISAVAGDQVKEIR